MRPSFINKKRQRIALLETSADPLRFAEKAFSLFIEANCLEEMVVEIEERIKQLQFVVQTTHILDRLGATLLPVGHPPGCICCKLTDACHAMRLRCSKLRCEMYLIL